jgi:hypothetical protein
MKIDAQWLDSGKETKISELMAGNFIIAGIVKVNFRGVWSVSIGDSGYNSNPDFNTLDDAKAWVEQQLTNGGE